MAKIIGVSHIIHSGFDSQALPKTYELVYEESTQWPQEKSKFVRQKPAEHKIAFWRSQRDVSIERMVHHPSSGPTDGPYRLIINSKTPGRQDVTTECVSEAFQTPAATVINPKESFDFTGAENLGPNRGAVALHTMDVDKTSEFWQKNLDFIPITKSSIPGKWQLLGLHSPFSKVKVQLLIVRAPTTPCFLDDRGWTALSLQVTSVEGCRKRLLQTSIEASPSFALTLGGKKFSLAFLRSPTGEIIELCEAKSL